MAKSPPKRAAHYHKDGSVRAKRWLRDGQLDGYWKWFRKDGTKMRSGHFDMGVQVGEWATYDAKGEVNNTRSLVRRRHSLCSRDAV